MNIVPRPHYRIRNSITGAYIHSSLCKIMEFYSKAEALEYIKQRGLNRSIYFVEVVFNDHRKS